MKKIAIFVMTLVLSVALIACGEKFNASVKIENTEIETTRITFDLKVTDDKNQITNNILVRLLDDKGDVVKESTKTVASLDENSEISFSSLTVSTEYTLVITTTYNEKNVELHKEKISTHNVLDYSITTVEDFLAIKNDQYSNYILMNDLDFTGYEAQIKASSITNFRGTFNGNGKTLKNYTIQTTDSNAGIFGQISGEAKIHDLTIDEFKMIDVVTDDKVNKVGASKYAGVLFGQNSSTTTKVENITILNSSIKLSVSSFSSYVKFGLLGGQAAGEFKNITIDDNSAIELNIDNLNKMYVGGVIGDINSGASLTNIYNKSNINIAINQTLESQQNDSAVELYVGGFVGRFQDSVLGTLDSIFIDGDINISNLEYFTQSTSTSKNLSLFIGGLFGDTKREFSNAIYSGEINVAEFKFIAKEPDHKKNYNVRIVVGTLVGNANEMRNASFNRVLALNAIVNIDKSNEEIRLDSDLLLGRATRVDYANSNLLGYSGASNLFINDEQQAVNGKLLDPAVLFKDNAWLLELL